MSHKIVSPIALCPVLPFLGFSGFLGKFKQGIVLVILVFSLSFLRILWVRQAQKILGNFEVFLDKAHQKSKEGQGSGTLRTWC